MGALGNTALPAPLRRGPLSTEYPPEFARAYSVVFSLGLRASDDADPMRAFDHAEAIRVVQAVVARLIGSGSSVTVAHGTYVPNKTKYRARYTEPYREASLVARALWFNPAGDVYPRFKRALPREVAAAAVARRAFAVGVLLATVFRQHSVLVEVQTPEGLSKAAFATPAQSVKVALEAAEHGIQVRDKELVRAELCRVLPRNSPSCTGVRPR